jgi:hypothetical protein
LAKVVVIVKAKSKIKLNLLAKVVVILKGEVKKIKNFKMIIKKNKKN